MRDDDGRMQHAGARWFRAGIVIASVALAGSCAGPHSGSAYRDPPESTSRVTSNALPTASRHQTVVVIGQFANPPRAAVNWRDIGVGMSETLARSLHNRGCYDVRMGERSWNHSADLPAVRKLHPDASIFVTGTVTDFHHTGELAEPLARKGMFGRRSEAVVAVQLSILDLHTGKVVVSDHVAGAAAAGAIPARELYEDLSFGSYLFWSTPLGTASDQVLARVMECIERAAPEVALQTRIIAMTGYRRVSLDGGRDRGLKVADEFYLLRDAIDGAAPALILDPVTGQPVRARIDSAGASTATAWLIGEPSSEAEIIGAALSDQPPASTPAANATATATAPTISD